MEEKEEPLHSKFHGDLFPPLGTKNRTASIAWNFGGFKKDSDGNLLTDIMYCALCPKSMKYRFSPNKIR